MRKSRKPNLSDALFLFAITYFGLAAPADAYFDIGTGTFMLQMVVAFLASVWLSLKSGWIKVDRKLKPKTETPENPIAPNLPPKDEDEQRGQT